MKITEIQITPIKPKEGLVAFASVVANNGLYLGPIGVHKSIDGSGYRITYPTKKVGEKSLNIYNPINKKTSKTIEESVILKAKKIFKQ